MVGFPTAQYRLASGKGSSWLGRINCFKSLCSECDLKWIFSQKDVIIAIWKICEFWSLKKTYKNIYTHKKKQFLVVYMIIIMGSVWGYLSKQWCMGLRGQTYWQSSLSCSLSWRNWRVLGTFKVKWFLTVLFHSLCK